MARLSDLGPDLDADLDATPETARVVKSGPQGVFVAPLGADTRHPHGPCRGPSHEDLEVGDVVLLVWVGDDQPWIAAVDKNHVDHTDQTGGGA